MRSISSSPPFILSFYRLGPSLFVLAAFTSFSSELGKRVVTYTIVEVDVSRPSQPQLLHSKLAPFFQPPIEVIFAHYIRKKQTPVFTVKPNIA